MTIEAPFSLKTYHSAQDFLDDNWSALSLHEVQNTYLLTTAQRAAKEGLSFYGNAVWTDQLVVALIWVDQSMLYASHVPESLCAQTMSLALSDLASKNPKIRSQISFMHAFQPALGYLETQYASVTDLSLKEVDRVWSHTIYGQDASLKLPSSSTTSIEFKLATEDMVSDYLIPWTQAFIDELEAVKIDMSASEMVKEAMEQQFIYVLTNQEGVPISMAWKRRPTLSGCSIAFVYTPHEHRGHQYASLCVGLLTELLLKKLDYVTLFVLYTQDPYKNLYAQLGYRLTGEAARIFFSV